MMQPLWIVAIIGSYLLGAIPFGVLIAKYGYHTDIRQFGSQNTGATNVWRVLGPGPGASTFVLDFLKGLGPVLVSKHLFEQVTLIPILVGMAAIVGHNWSLFLNGKGGKGVATSAGVFLGLIPMHTLIAVSAFGIVFIITRRISIGSMASALTLVGSTFFINTPLSMRIVSILASIMILIKHLPNIKRLARGEEPKVNLR